MRTFTEIRNLLKQLQVWDATQPHLKQIGKEHGFFLQPTLSQEVISQFEARNQIELPSGFREFLAEIGNGGAGPYYGLYPLNAQDVIPQLKSPFLLGEALSLVGHCSDTNRLEEFFIRCKTIEGYTENFEACCEKIVNDLSFWNGALPIANYGCGIEVVLIVSGQCKGQVWVNDFANLMGLFPVHTTNDLDSRLTFREWYEVWLDYCTAKMQGIETLREPKLTWIIDK